MTAEFYYLFFANTGDAVFMVLCGSFQYQTEKIKYEIQSKKLRFNQTNCNM